MTDDMRYEEEETEELITLSDEDGNDVTLRVQGRIEVGGQEYLVVEDVEDEGSVLIFIEETDEDGETLLNPVEDEDECQTVFDYFIAEFDDYEFCDAE